ncbi:MAG: phosphatase PAP2 family protein [Bdellovibrionales bacterium]|nr:phosphatase PAP2 family protein [Bdellovibrionales bacterium]
MGFLLLLMSMFAFSEETLWETFKKDMASPVTTKAKTTTIYASATSLTFIVFEDALNDQTEDEVAKERPLGRASKIGDLAGQMIPNALYAIGMYANYYFTENKESLSRTKLMLKSSFYSGLVVSVLKYTVREPRPNNRESRNSFPSGHTASAFAFASVVGAEHGLYYGTAAYALAALVGFSRMNDNKHYMHDVISGASIGLMYGLGLYYRKEETEKENDVALVPVIVPGYAGASAVYYF